MNNYWTRSLRLVELESERDFKRYSLQETAMIAKDESIPKEKPLTGLSKKYKHVHVFWLAGMSCDGCSIAVTGATNPPIENLLAGTVPGLPQLILHHPVLAVEAGSEFTESFYQAARVQPRCTVSPNSHAGRPNSSNSGSGPCPCKNIRTTATVSLKNQLRQPRYGARKRFQKIFTLGIGHDRKR